MAAITALTGPAIQPYASAHATSAGTALQRTASAVDAQDPAAPKSVYTLQEGGVHISAGAIVLQLHEQGQSPLSIASSTGISIDEVNCYLGVKVQKALEQQVAAAHTARA